MRTHTQLIMLQPSNNDNLVIIIIGIRVVGPSLVARDGVQCREVGGTVTRIMEIRRDTAISKLHHIDRCLSSVGRPTVTR